MIGYIIAYYEIKIIDNEVLRVCGFKQLLQLIWHGSLQF